MMREDHEGPDLGANTLYTVREVALALRVTPKTATHWLQDGRIRGVKVTGGRYGSWRVRRADLEAFIEGMEP